MNGCFTVTEYPGYDVLPGLARPDLLVGQSLRRKLFTAIELRPAVAPKSP